MSFQPIIDAAFADYVKQTAIDPIKHPFADRLQTCHSPDDVLKLIEEKTSEFKDYREGNRKLIDCLKPVVNVIHAFSEVLSEAASLVPFQPAGAIFAGVDILLTAAGGVSSSYDALVDLFDCVANFLKRLRIYTNLPSTPSMVEISVKIMVELLAVLALATKQIKLGRFKKFAKKLLGESEIEAVLQRLDRLTQEEGRMTMAQTLEVVHCLMNNVKVVMDDGKVSMDGIWKALDTMQQIASDINKMRRDQLRRDSRSWLSPPDPSINYNTACETHHDGTALWFFQGSVFTEWNAKGSLLWIYGKSGSGKSILMSSIIQEIDRMCKSGLASMAYFFFDFRDTQKQHRRDLLSSLLFQLSAKSNACYHVFSRFYLDHDEGARQPSEAALTQCLMEMLKVQGQPTMYIIIDALDECPDISGMPTPREKVLTFLEDLVGLQLQNAHICLSSRPEFDIRTSLEPLAPFRVPLDDETGQQADILEYIKSVVHSDRRMRNWSAEDKQLVIGTLSDKADGMFRWVYCQLENLRRCFPSNIRGTLGGLPKTLDATYEHMLLGIDEDKWQFAHRLFQCLSVSVRPLRVEELAEILAVRFDGEVVPQFDTGWQLSNAEEAVLSACSSLISIVNTNGSRIVQFAHFSVKEFLTSDRLATASQNLSRYYIIPHLAHATLAQASLGVLLQLNDRIDKESIKNFPLADYAARHWFSHCRLGNLTSTIQDATKCLFDREKPHFSAWVWIYDIDDPWRKSMPSKQPEQPEANPLYYAILCGFRWLIEYLIVTYPGDVDTSGGYYETPLLAAVRMKNVNVTLSSPPHDVGVPVNGDMHGASPSERVEIVWLLLEHNADVNLQNEDGEVPLHWSTFDGKLEISRLLVKRGANVQSANKDGWTPLKGASQYEHLDVVRFLIDSGADVNSHDNDGWTPLHSASRMGHVHVVELLIQHGADINKLNDNQETALHMASSTGNLEISRLLVQRGTDVDSRSRSGWTPLKIGSHNGHLDVVLFLINSGADVNSHDNEGRTPLHSASRMGYVQIVELLIQHVADINKQNDDQDIPLHLASSTGNLEISRLLVLHGADVNARNKRGCTPLHSAAVNGHLDIVKLLLERGADFSIRDDSDRTPFDLASINGQPEVADLLSGYMTGSTSLGGAVNTTPSAIGPQSSPPNVHPPRERGEGVTHSHNRQHTLFTASQYGELDIVRSFLDRGSDVNERYTGRNTALHIASIAGQLEVVKLLIERGADVDFRDRDGRTPLIRASEFKQFEVARLLLDHGADVNVQTRANYTTLRHASFNGNIEMARLLLERGANVDVRDANGQTPRQIAIQGGFRKVVELLENSTKGSP